MLLPLVFPSTKAHKYYGFLVLAHNISPILHIHGYLDDPQMIYNHFTDHLLIGDRLSSVHDNVYVLHS